MNNVTSIYNDIIKFKSNSGALNCRGALDLGSACCKCNRCIDEIEHLYNEYKYYSDEIECFCQYNGDKVCKLCKSLKGHIYDKCEKSSKVWSNLQIYVQGENIGSDQRPSEEFLSDLINEMKIDIFGDER